MLLGRHPPWMYELRPNGLTLDMATSQIEVESRVTELATQAFKTFCDDISGKFGVDMECEQQEITTETVASLKKRFNKLVAVNIVDSEGLLGGTFRFIFDQEGLFTLGGIIVMLPEEQIISNRQNASTELAESMVDAIGEAGNLLVGSWDRVFSEGLEGHNHFSHRLPAFVGKPWDKSEETIGLAGDEEVYFIPYEMTVGSYPAFNCGVIFPKTIFGESSDFAPEQTIMVKQGTQEETEENNQDMQPATDEKEGAAKQESEVSAEEKDTALDGNAADNVTEEKAPVTEESEESTIGGISETIQKMTQSSAVLPGESGRSAVAKDAAFSVRSPKDSGTGYLFEIRANDIMQNKVTWASPDDSLQQALAKMQQTDAGYIMIGQNGVLEGIVSHSDITRAMSPYLQPIFAKWRQPLDDATLKIRIKWIMSRPVRTIKPETSLAASMEYMSQFRGRCLPVTDEQGNVQGLVTAFDIIQALLKSSSDTFAAGETAQALVESAATAGTT
jgi:CBS domain-containing protein